MLNSAKLQAGDIINNGFYDIQLTESPRENDGRWFARGRRWVQSTKKWQDKIVIYGWQGDPFTPCQGSWRA